MNRRSTIKSIMLASIAPKTLAALAQPGDIISEVTKKKHKKVIENGNQQPYQSKWEELPDMIWTGEELWAQRLQDWQIKGGKLYCNVCNNNRTVHHLTRQLSKRTGAFQTSVIVKIPLNNKVVSKGIVGFKLGVKGRFDDYRSAIMTGNGVDAGISPDGILTIGDQHATNDVDSQKLQEGIKLVFVATPDGDHYDTALSAYSLPDNKLLSSVNSFLSSKDLIGNIALLCHFDNKKSKVKPSESDISFSQWQISGDKVEVSPEHVFGPIYFAQYTLNEGLLKLTAQLAPLDLKDAKARLDIFEGGKWQQIAVSTVDPLKRTAHFRISPWTKVMAVPYRVQYRFQSRSGKERFYFYEGIIASEPVSKESLKALVCSCNWDLGFPDQEVVENASKHKADAIMFLGDQFYEANGSFGIETAPLKEASLDYLRKWYQFGWSYRELFRQKPSIFIPDDHDVYQGNLWGSDGKDTVHKGAKANIQDSGGYFMSPEWVNIVMGTQTSHMPDPYDPEPIKRGIHVFYTNWNYAGISFAIIEDRKWKSAPKNILPKTAEVWNGFIENKDFDITSYPEPDIVSLLGERQLAFVEEWTTDWRQHTEMKILVSATPFMCLQTFPEGIDDDNQNESLPIPKPGEYVEGDHMATDMDSDGWPQNKRDEALRKIRKGFAMQLTGDQHLPAIVHYGVDEYGDSAYTFVVPALNNIWPRRWWPPIPKDHHPLDGIAAYTGNFRDGFGNRITVHAAANPHKTGRKPSLLYDRSTGYGIVIFNKKLRQVTMECWPRYVDPLKNPDGQYKGWPLTVNQLDNYRRKAIAYLPQLNINLDNQVVQVINEATNDIEYTIRIKGKLFRPKVFSLALHTLRVGDPDTDVWKEYKGLKPIGTKRGSLKIELSQAL